MFLKVVIGIFICVFFGFEMYSLIRTIVVKQKLKKRLKSLNEIKENNEKSDLQ